MTIVEVVDDPDAVALTLPGSVRKVHELARDLGWAVSVTFADGPPTNVALRFARGSVRAYALWHLIDNRARFAGSAAARIPGGHLRTLAVLKAFLAEVPE